jgi:hypothetical protein
VQDVPYAKLQARLLADGQVLGQDGAEGNRAAVFNPPERLLETGAQLEKLPHDRYARPASVF